MPHYLVIGAGAVGRGVTELLTDRGDTVTVVTRHGAGPQRAGVTLVAADAGDRDAMAALATGAAAIFNCANPAYHRWPTDWPPIADALLSAAEASGAVLVTTSNLYPYGPPSGPMSPDTPMAATYAKAVVRAQMWRDALSAHREGRVRVTEVRASDYVGPDSQSVLTRLALPRVRAGKTVRVIGDPDVAHSWTFTLDVATALVAVADTPAAWGRAWHAPTNAARTQREAIDDLADAARVPHVPVRSIPWTVLRAVGLVSRQVRELRHTRYQFDAPFIIDDAATRSELGLVPTPWAEVLRATVEGVSPRRPVPSGPASARR